MKKILITGMNKNQCTENFYLSQQLKVVPSHPSLIACLRDMDYTVEQRVVEIGENLEEYDKVIVYIHNPSGFAGYVYNALWAIHKRKDCILAFDDWQTDSIYKGLLNLENPETLFRKFILESHKSIPDNIRDYEDQLIDALKQVKSKRNKMLISAFSGGDLSLLIDYPEELLFSYNPNPYHINRQPDGGGLFAPEKKRIFNFAGLVQDKTKKWLKAQGVEDSEWPLKKYGSRKDGQDRVTEPEIVNLYQEHWGVLMAGYFHAGSGWWRARPLQVADADSILIGEPKEMMLYYHDEELANVTASQIINMTDQELEDIARRQKEALYRNHPLDKNVQKKELSLVL